MSRIKIEKTSGFTWGLSLSSGCDEYPTCKLTLQVPRRYISVRLPQILKPERTKVTAQYWDAATIERMGRDWYWNIIERRYGFYLSEGFLNVYLGRCTMDSSTEQRWGYFLPWTQFEHVRHSLYDLDGNWLCDLPQWKNSLGVPWTAVYDQGEQAKAAQPKAYFLFRDYDGKEIKVRCAVEEREWRRGTGWFTWLRWFTKRNISRSLDLQFSEEVGPRKGSWKGGTIGHSISMLAGESVTAAFKRYCTQQHKLEFIGATTPFEDNYTSADQSAKCEAKPS